MTTRRPEGSPLTARQREVAGLVLDGLTSRTIARRLGISERTVHAHLRSIYSKTGVGSRVLLTIWLLENGAEARSPVP